MDCDITFYDLLFQLLNLIFVHCLYLVVLVEICLLEMLKLPLQILKLLGDSFVLLGQGLVRFFERPICLVELLFELPQLVVQIPLFLREICQLVIVLLLRLLQDFQVVI